MKQKNDNIEEIDWCDYPYIGIGQKPMSNKRIATCEQLERIIAG